MSFWAPVLAEERGAEEKKACWCEGRSGERTRREREGCVWMARARKAERRARRGVRRIMVANLGRFNVH